MPHVVSEDGVGRGEMSCVLSRYRLHLIRAHHVRHRCRPISRWVLADGMVFLRPAQLPVAQFSPLTVRAASHFDATTMSGVTSET